MTDQLTLDLSDLKWKKIKYKDKEKLKVENMLRYLEETCVSVCDRFLNMIHSRDHLWSLCNKKKELKAVVLNSRSTLMPVLCGLDKIPPLKFLKGFLRKKKIHSAQGLLEDVLVLEKELEAAGRKSIQTFDYDLMNLDHLPLRKNITPLENLVLRAPALDDVDALLPLRKGYEEEEVLPRGSVFNPAASRLLLVNFISKKRILAAWLDGKLAGKIVVNAASFTRYQIGGVYVLPEYRGRGIASRMTHEFVNKLINEDRGITLFVKKNNIPAKRLYSSLGFKYKDDYRITYY